MEPQEKILKTSLELFFKFGIKRVTMDDIAKELGMSKKTIYQYYKEKDDIVNQMCEVELIKQQKKFEDVTSLAKNPIHEIMLISQNVTEMLENVNPMFFLDSAKISPRSVFKISKL